MRVPRNKIKTGKYTSGGEFIELLTNQPYQGYYYELNNKFYIGKEYTPSAVEIIRVQQQNQLYNQGLSTALFSFISGITSQALSSPHIPGVSIQKIKGDGNSLNNDQSIKYYSQQINVKPIIIKEITKEVYDSLQGNPLYKTTFVGPTQDINQAEKQIPGLKSFLRG